MPYRGVPLGSVGSEGLWIYRAEAKLYADWCWVVWAGLLAHDKHAAPIPFPPPGEGCGGSGGLKRGRVGDMGARWGRLRGLSSSAFSPYGPFPTLPLLSLPSPRWGGGLDIPSWKIDKGPGGPAGFGLGL